MHKEILDMCCGSKMFYFDKDRPEVLSIDNREWEGVTHGRKVSVKPDMLADFRQMPFEDNAFHHIVFDPPHLIHAGENSWLNKKYGKLDPATWKDDLKRGFEEGWRVLKPGGTLIFKWSEHQIPIKEVLSICPLQPLYGHLSGKSGKTHWIVFYKRVTPQ